MSQMFDLNDIPKAKRHLYFYIFLVLLTLLAGTIKNHFCSDSSPERELANEVKELLDSGATSRDFY